MPLGLSPLATGPTGASATPTPTIVTAGGVAVAVLGMSATASVGDVTTSIAGRNVLTGMSATASLGIISVITPNMTSVFLSGFEMTSGIGVAQPASPVEVVLEGLEAIGVQASIDYIAVGTAVLEGVSGTGVLGQAVATTPDRWVEIDPVSVPGWTEVNILN